MLAMFKELVMVWIRLFALSPIYMAENFWHGSDESVTCTQKNGTDYSFTCPFSYCAKRCEINDLAWVKGSTSWPSYLILA